MKEKVIIPCEKRRLWGPGLFFAPVDRKCTEERRFFAFRGKGARVLQTVLSNVMGESKEREAEVGMKGEGREGEGKFLFCLRPYVLGPVLGKGGSRIGSVPAGSQEGRFINYVSQ